MRELMERLEGWYASLPSGSGWGIICFALIAIGMGTDSEFAQGVLFVLTALCFIIAVALSPRGGH